MLLPAENNIFNLESISQNAEFDFHNNGQSGFILSNDATRIELNHLGPDPLTVDFLGAPHIRLESAIDPRRNSSDGIETYRMLVLSSNPNDENLDCIVLAESELKTPISLEDTNGDVDFYNILKGLEGISGQYFKETKIESQKEWFENSNRLVYETLVGANFYKTYEDWFREVKFSRMSLFNRAKWKLGLSYRFKHWSKYVEQERNQPKQIE